jgi:hypothetical protein
MLQCTLTQHNKKGKKETIDKIFPVLRAEANIQTTSFKFVQSNSIAQRSSFRQIIKQPKTQRQKISVIKKR